MITSNFAVGSVKVLLRLLESILLGARVAHLFFQDVENLEILAKTAASPNAATEDLGRILLCTFRRS